ncbi:MAG: FHA domain-containing protein [Amphritea sp.]
MTISIQLVEVPENEQAINRQVSLPGGGGTIGRSYGCTLQLPDFNRQLSRVHAEITSDSQGRFQVVDLSTNGLFVNGTLLGKGHRKPLRDGDVLKLGGYVLLISDMVSLFADQPEPSVEMADAAGRREPEFSMDSLNADDLGWPDSGEAVAKPTTASDMFSKDNVLADDQLGYDPFDDEFEMKQPNMAVHGDIVSIEPSSSSDVQQLMTDSLTQLNKLMEQQKQSQMEPFGHDQLMDCLQRTLDRFLVELSPEHLEDTFNDYISGWGAKDKKYWRLYRKQFNRKLERKEFHRQFSALFVEELRGKR